MKDHKEITKYSNIQVLYHIWLENTDHENVIDDDIWLLLKAIADKGSLVKAADALKISYRKAWGDLKKTEQKLGFSLIEKHRGGSKGGETLLSEEGRTFIEAYNQFHEDFEEAIQPAVITFKRKIKGRSL